MIPGKTLSASLTAQPVYVEDVFSTYLYTGTGAAQTITNGIDLANEGGLVWLKRRDGATQSHGLFDSQRTNGLSDYLSSNLTGAPTNDNGGTMVFNTNGFVRSLESYFGGAGSGNGNTYASWTFRKAEKFFDMVTYTGNGTAGRTVSHNLGSVPGCIIIKCTSIGGDNWRVYHRSLGATKNLRLNGTDAENTSTTIWNNTEPTSTNFTLGTGANVNASGETFVAYLFAHDAGGFGDSGSDNVISCGSYTATGNDTINLGYEPQWILEKRVSNSGDDWEITDNMRGFSMTGFKVLAPNTSAAEVSYAGFRQPTSTGYINTYWGSGTIIYIAIRRGPMKTPEAGTEVFEPKTRSGTGGATTVTTTVRPDTVLQNWRSGGLGSASHFMYDRLRGVAQALFTDTTDAESTQTATGINAFNNLSYGIAGAGSMNNGSATYVDYVFTRAPGFFDIVCYTGNSVAGQTFAHNLTVPPDLAIVKARSASGDNWWVFSSAFSQPANNYFIVNGTFALQTATGYGFTTSATNFAPSPADASTANVSGRTYVAYLFATLAGVSKVGSYTGTGTTQQINCGFTGGARFVLIKRTDSTGDWYVWDTARGIVSGNDPYLLLNSTAAEVTSTDYIDTYSQGFEISSTAPDAINANGGTFIFLAIA